MYARVYVEITNICNMQCSFCHGHSREKRRMQLGEFSHILHQLEGKTQYVYYHLMGEPLTHPELPEFLQLARQRGFRSVITTNGTLLSKRGSQILEAGVHKVYISLHSFEDGTQADFDRYLQQIGDFARLARRFGTIVSLRLWNKGFDGGRNQEVLARLQALFPDPWTENSRGFRILDGLFLEWGERFAWPDREAQDGGSNVYCYGLKNHFGILCDGTVVPCCLDSDGVINLGNVFSQPLEQILQSKRAQAMARGFQCRNATEELCRKCGYARRF